MADIFTGKKFHIQCEPGDHWASIGSKVILDRGGLMFNIGEADLILLRSVDLEFIKRQIPENLWSRTVILYKWGVPDEKVKELRKTGRFLEVALTPIGSDYETAVIIKRDLERLERRR